MAFFDAHSLRSTEIWFVPNVFDSLSFLRVSWFFNNWLSLATSFKRLFFIIPIYRDCYVFQVTVESNSELQFHAVAHPHQYHSDHFPHPSLHTYQHVTLRFRSRDSANNSFSCRVIQTGLLYKTECSVTKNANNATHKITLVWSNPNCRKLIIIANTPIPFSFSVKITKPFAKSAFYSYLTSH